MSAYEIFCGGVAVITGAGAGIGAGLARHASRLGMTVVLADIDADAIAALRDELCAAGAPHWTWCAMFANTTLCRRWQK